MKKILGVLILINFIFIENVFAKENYNFIERNIPDSYVYLDADDSPMTWTFPISIYKDSNSNKIFYNIDPGLEIINNAFTSYDYNVSMSSLTDEEYNKVKLLVYYGYNYTDNDFDHSDDKWYEVTQLMIWRVLRNNWSINFTSKLYGGIILENKYIDEINEIQYLVDNHNETLPDFSNDNFEITLNETLEIVDKNNVINNYKIKHNEDLDITINNNIMSIKPKKTGSYQIELYKDYDVYEETIMLYITDNGANTINIGNLNTLSITINVESTVGDIYFINNKNNLEEKYNIYDENDNFIGTIIFNNEKESISNFLKFGKYYLINSDDEKQFFEINTPMQKIYINNTNLDKELTEEIIKEEDYSNLDDLIVPENKIIINVPKTGLNIIKPYNNLVYILPRNKYYDKKKC